MLSVGDRVYQVEKRANGKIVEIDNNKQRDKYKVVFFWAKYCDIKHGNYRGVEYPERKWQWCSEDTLVVTKILNINRVSIQTERSLGALVTHVCELPKYRGYGDGSDIVIRYTLSGRSVNRSIPLIINEHLVWNKFEQQLMMGEDIGLKVSNGTSVTPGWVAKPYHSIGGKGIYRIGENDVINPSTHYSQEPFNKVREFRTHVFMWMNEPLQLIQEKVINDTSQLCWNKKQGGRFWTIYQKDNPATLTRGDRINNELLEKLSQISIVACKKLGYDLGGIDLGMDSAGNLKIFEVNSRMGLREQSLFTYKKCFNALKGIDINEYKQVRATWGE